MPTKKIRIYELARELGVENQVVLDLADELKMGVKSHSSSIEDAMADRVRRLADTKGLRRAEEPAPEPPPPPAPTPEPSPVPASAAVAQATPAPAEAPRDAPHRVVRSTGGIPEPPPLPSLPPRVVRSTGGIPEPAAPAAREPVAAPRPSAAAPPPAPPAPPATPDALRSPTGKPIPPPPGQRRTPPPSGPRMFTPSTGGPPRGGGGGAPAGGRPRFGAGPSFPGRPGGGPGGGGPGGGRGGPPGRRSGPQGQRPRRKKRRRRDFEDLGPASPTALTPLDAPVPDGEIVVPRGVTMQEYAPKLNRNTADLVRLLLDAGEMVTATQTLADEMIELIAETLGAEVLIVEPGQEQELELQALLGEDDEDDLALQEPRPPIVTVMGHVDHGKTTLLDAIRTTRVAAGEAGGITQHIGAYQADYEGRTITFIDTPGHEAFTAMRARGAQATDIAVLVVAADDGVMPQTVEAINHARAAEVPIIAAITKVDREDADAQRVRQQLVEQSLVPEEWGGDTIVVEVAAPENRGVSDLLEAVVLVADVEELTANPKAPARAFVLEANLDQGRGPVVTALVERGTLRVGEPVVAGNGWGKVRALFDDHNQAVKEAIPSMPVEVLGLDDLPLAGDELRVAPDEKTARTVAEARARRRHVASMAHPMTLAGGARLEDIFAMVQRGEVATLNLVLKADVHGSLEALTEALRKLDQDHEEVRLSFVHRGVGGINESDVNLAAVSNATVVGFNVRPDRKARELAETEHVELRLYEVIYQVLEDVTAALVGLLQPEFEEIVTGDAEVREVFSVPRVGKVAGCFVQNGHITRGSRVRFLRDGVVIWNGTITSLKRFKDDVRDVQSGYECGIGLSDFQDLHAGDVIETYELKEIARTLS
ncbi:MAG TPA: translation initiation factor IF-2 [Acidimicrobiia bacterium]|nr:translation initiation factor IF-2 [Acidimicrobiia bacterium]